MRNVRMVVWGLGRHAVKNILPAVRESLGITLHGVCSRNRERVFSVAEEWKCNGWLAADEMLEDPAVDAVYLSTPTGLHEVQARQILEAGKHCWCEKPLGMSADRVGALLELSRRQGVTIGEAFMYLHHSHLAHVRRLMMSGRLGQIRSLLCRFGIPPLEDPGFRNDAALGGGAFFDVGVYPISAVVALFPESEPEIVLAKIIRHDTSAVDVEGRAVLCYEGEIHATLEWGTNCAYRNELDIWGTRSSLVTERIFSKGPNYVPQFLVRDLHGELTVETGSAGNHFTVMLEYFRGLLDNPVGAEDERIAVGKRAVLTERIRRASIT